MYAYYVFVVYVLAHSMFEVQYPVYVHCIRICMCICCCCSPDLIPIGDHCSQDVNLRLTEGGYITADIAVDFPPLPCVLLDPLTG